MIKPRKGLYFSLNISMKWYLIWFLTVTLPNGQELETIESRMMMDSEKDCELAVPAKMLEQEILLGSTGRVYGRTVAPTGGQGTVTAVHVGCILR